MHRSLQIGALATLLGTLLLMAACSGKGNTAAVPSSNTASSHATSAAKDPCTLASPADIGAAFGGTVGQGSVDSGLPDPICKFPVTGSNLGMDGAVVVFLSPEQTASTFAVTKRAMQSAVGVSGVGDDALYNPQTTSLEFIKSGVVGSVQAIFINPGGPSVDAAKVKDDTDALAKKVAARI
jgi:hypothetical protein